MSDLWFARLTIRVDFRDVMPKDNQGVLFSVPLPDGTFISGRVMVDIHACLKRRLFPSNSPLPGLGRAYLVEMYSTVTREPEYVESPLLVNGAFIESQLIGDTWPVVGRQEIDPTRVEFPESLMGFIHPQGQVAFQVGEMRIQIPLTQEAIDSIGEYGVRHSAFLWPFTCLRLLGRESEVPPDYKMATLAGADLRHSPKRCVVYEHLPFPMEVPYYEKQKQMGFDLDRLYS